MTSYKSNYRNPNDIVPYWIIKVDEIIDYAKRESHKNPYEISDKYKRYESEGL